LRGKKQYTFNDLIGGVDLDAAGYLLNGNRARDMRNLSPLDRGGLRKRDGCRTVWTPTAPVRIESLFGINHRELGSGTNGWLIAATYDGSTGVDLFKIDPIAGTATSIKGAVSLTGAAGLYEFAIGPVSGGQGPLYGFPSGTSVPNKIYWTGSGNAGVWTASGGSMPTTANGLLYHEARMWVAGGSLGGSDEYTVSWSSAGDPRNWSTVAPNDAGSVQLDPGDGQPIIALAPLGKYLLVFKWRKIFLMYDLDTGANRKITSDYGAVAPRCVAATPHGVAFLDEKGLFLTDGSSFIELSAPIRSLFKTWGLQTLSTFPDDYAIAYWGNTDSIFVSNYRGDSSREIIEYSFKHKAWFRHRIESEATGRSAQCLATCDVLSYRTKLFAAESNLGVPSPWRLMELFDSSVTQDNGLEIPWNWVGPWHDFGSPLIQKRVREIRVDGEGTMQLEAAMAPTDALDVLDQTAWESAGSEATERRFYTPGLGRLVSLKLSGSSSGPVEIRSYLMGVDHRVS
jgi:hypothetical protein